MLPAGPGCRRARLARSARRWLSAARLVTRLADGCLFGLSAGRNHLVADGQLRHVRPWRDERGAASRPNVLLRALLSKLAHVGAKRALRRSLASGTVAAAAAVSWSRRAYASRTR